MDVRALTPAADRFDDLTRSLAKGTVSRRRTLALIGSSLFGGVLGSVSLFDDTDAAKSCKQKCKKKDDKKARKRCRKRCEKKEQPRTDCPNIGTACGKGSSTLVCNCRLDKEGKQQCGNVVNPPNGVAFTPCILSSECGDGQFCDFGGNVCRRSCETA
jgi:hypothetical protein